MPPEFFNVRCFGAWVGRAHTAEDEVPLSYLSSENTFIFFLLARPPCTVVHGSSIVLHFVPALDPLPVSEDFEAICKD